MDPGRVQLPEEDQKGLEPVDPSARFCPVCSHWQVGVVPSYFLSSLTLTQHAQLL